MESLASLSVKTPGSGAFAGNRDGSVVLTITDSSKNKSLV